MREGSPVLSDRCRRMEKISDEVIDRTIKLYEQNKLVQFWEAVEAAAVLQEVKNSVCEIGE